MKTFSVGISLILIVLVIQASTAKACFVGPPSEVIEDLNQYNYFVRDYNRAEAIFAGKMIAIDWFRMKFKINKIWKGNASDEFTMSTGALPYSNSDEVRVSSCDYNFVLGESYLVLCRKKKLRRAGCFFSTTLRRNS